LQFLRAMPDHCRGLASPAAKRRHSSKDGFVVTAGAQKKVRATPIADGNPS
jgi:hypothetical protein